MAYLRKLARGWRAEVEKLGVRASKVLPTRQEAKVWAAEQETLIEQRKILGGAKRANFWAACQRYAEEVSPKKDGARWEGLRLRKFADHWLGEVMLAELGAPHFTRWRDERLAKVKPATVRREWNLLSAVCATAKEEWHWIKHDPTEGVKMPRKPARRSRRPTADEIERIQHVAGYGGKCVTLTQLTVAAFMFAIETGMRAGEILSLRHDQIRGRVAHLPKTKNGEARDVPLSPEALRILKLCPGLWESLSDRTRDALWRKLCKAAMVDNLHFHDSRHEAITRLSKKLNVLELARMVGHKNLNELMTYYEDDAEDVAGRL